MPQRLTVASAAAHFALTVIIETETGAGMRALIANARAGEVLISAPSWTVYRDRVL
jgi:hypothetical protein